MLKVSGFDIQLTRGDTGPLQFNARAEDGEKYFFQPDDHVLFTVRERCKNAPGAFAFQRAGTLPEDMDESEYIEVVILPEDTAALAFGLYDYDIQLQIQGDPQQTYTLIDAEAGSFKIRREATF